MKARVKATFTFDVYVNGEYSNELSFISGNTMTFKQAVTLATKKLRNLSVAHAQIFLSAGSLAVADVTMFNREITINDYNTTPAETYAVCWGDEYKEEDGESNAIATTSSESDAKEIAESESETNNCTMSVVRKSDRKVIAIYNNTPETPSPDNTTPATMNANETKAPECPKYKNLSYAGTRLENYLCTRKTDECFTITAITQAVDCIKDNARCMSRPDFWETIAAIVKTFGAVKNAVFRSRRLVESEGLKYSAKDIDQVTRRYAAHIVACAKYEIENA